MMPTTNETYEALKVDHDQRGHRAPVRPNLVSWLFASMLVAVPLPAFADAGLSENIAIKLSSRIIGSQVGQDVVPSVVPGSLVDFSVSVTGPSEGGSPATSFAITDKVPEHLVLFVGDLDPNGNGPATFKDHDSGLDFSFDGLASRDDSIEFSSDGGKSFGYVPVADGDGFDANVTHVKFRPRGALLATTGHYERFSLSYRMKVK